ncbi:MAG: ATP-dependent Clp protease adaptor ClpS [Clostridium sp.]|nr:ATP-dependent Clp protease adaptor ClpS [Clostridium sp.]
MENKVVTKEKSKIKFKKPKQYNVIMENDDFTTMEFVIDVLINVFNKESVEANRIMLDVHSKGRGLVGVYPYDIAVTKVSIAMNMAKEEGFPFMITIEEV